MIVDLDDEISCWTSDEEQEQQEQQEQQEHKAKDEDKAIETNTTTKEEQAASASVTPTTEEAVLATTNDDDKGTIAFTTEQDEDDETPVSSSPLGEQEMVIVFSTRSTENDPIDVEGTALLDDDDDDDEPFKASINHNVETKPMAQDEAGSGDDVVEEEAHETLSAVPRTKDMEEDGFSSLSSEQDKETNVTEESAVNDDKDEITPVETNENDNKDDDVEDDNSSLQKSPSETEVESDDTETSHNADGQKNNKKRNPVRFNFSYDDMEESTTSSSNQASENSETEVEQIKKKVSSARPGMTPSTASTTRRPRPTLQKSTTQTSRDITRTIRTKTTLKLVDLIKALYSLDPMVVANCFTQLHALIDQQLSDEDNTLELGVIRRGGHLAMLRSLQHHQQVPAIQAMGWAALAWLCEHCNIKAILMDNGALPLVMSILRYYSVTSPNWAVVTEALYVVGHLSTLRKVARQVRYNQSDSWQELVPRLNMAYKEAGQDDDAVESAVDAFLFCSHHWAAHRSIDILQGVWQAGSLRFVVQVLQHALVCWQQAHAAGSDDACAVYEERLAKGCRIVTHWAKTPAPAVVRALIEAGALTVAAEVLRLFPAGSPMRKAANPCLRAMVPSTED